MGTSYRYHLRKGGCKQICPNCRKKTFVHYIDSATGNILPSRYGRCDREIKCAYHLNPCKDGFAVHSGEQKISAQPVIPKRKRASFQPLSISWPTSLIQVDLFKQSLKGYQTNNFVKWLSSVLGSEITSHLIGKYFIGTSSYWPGATVFWQVDRFGKIRAGKIMLYHSCDGRRVKKPYNHITWAHRVLAIANFNLTQCFFGEHLLSRNGSNRIAIVESEKTAIIASAYLPQFTWLAAGSLSNISIEKCKVLSGRDVYFFPDLKALEKWTNKAESLSQVMYQTRFRVSDFLERNASEDDKILGLDLADYLIQFDWQQFRELNKSI